MRVCEHDVLPEVPRTVGWEPNRRMFRVYFMEVILRLSMPSVTRDVVPTQERVRRDISSDVTVSVLCPGCGAVGEIICAN